MIENQNHETNLNPELESNQEIFSNKNEQLLSAIDQDAPTQIELDQETFSKENEQLLSAIDQDAPTQIELDQEDFISAQNEVKKIKLPELPQFPQILEQEIESNPLSLNTETGNLPSEIEEKESQITESVAKKKKLSLGSFFGFLKSGFMIPLFVIIAGIIVAKLALNSLQSSDPSGYLNPTEMNESNSPNPNNPTVQDLKVQVYWLEDKNNQIALVPQYITIDQSDTPQNSLKSAFERLLVGSNNPDYSSAIPQGTKLLDLRVLGQNIYIDLSKEFTTGGGSASMTGRLGQVLYTATSLDNEAQIYLSIENEVLEVLGGEGIMVDQPLTRSNFEENFPL